MNKESIDKIIINIDSVLNSKKSKLTSIDRQNLIAVKESIRTASCKTDLVEAVKIILRIIGIASVLYEK